MAVDVPSQRTQAKELLKHLESIIPEFSYREVVFLSADWNVFYYLRFQMAPHHFLVVGKLHFDAESRPYFASSRHGLPPEDTYIDSKEQLLQLVQAEMAFHAEFEKNHNNIDSDIVKT